MRQDTGIRLGICLAAWLWTLPLASPSWAISAPSLRLALKTGWTDNLLGDSLGQADSQGALSLRLLQPLQRALALEAGGSLLHVLEHDELDESSQSLSLQAGGSSAAFEGLWAQVGWFRLNHHDIYDLYDRDRISTVMGLRRRQGESVRLRSQLQLSSTTFSRYPDSLEADYRDAALSLGANWALPLPLSLDGEAGLQIRRYPDLDPAVDTPWLWTTGRISRPLGESLGLRLQLSRRWQLSAQDDELATLSANGLDPGDLLWDGWRVELGLTRMSKGWRSSLTLDGLSNRYAAEAGSAARQDDGLGVALLCSRAWNLRQSGWQVQLSLEGSHRRTRSTLSFYESNTSSLLAGLTLQGP